MLTMTVAMSLVPGNWEPSVKAELEGLVRRNAGNPAAYAVFDFDNTTAIGDISNVCQWRMLETLAFNSAGTNSAGTNSAGTDPAKCL